jgi:hypothetical protein
MSHHYSGPDFGFPRGDARLDFTDLYAFPKPGDPRESILIMNFHPYAVVNPPDSTDPTRPASFPSNGRTLTDDAADAFLAILTKGKVTGDKVGAQRYA